MTEVSRSAPEGMASTLLAEAGLTLSADRYYAKSVIDGLPPGSPLHSAPFDVHIALASQGHSFTSFLVREAEEHLVSGRPMAFLNREWAESRVKKMKADAAEARRREREPSEPVAVLLARYKLELEEERARRIEAERVAEEALTLLEAIK